MFNPIYFLTIFATCCVVCGEASKIYCDFNQVDSNACQIHGNSGQLELNIIQNSGSDAYLNVVPLARDGSNVGASIQLELATSTDNVQCLGFNYSYFGFSLPEVSLVRKCYENSSLIGSDLTDDRTLWHLDGTSLTNRDWNAVQIPLYYKSNTPIDQCSLEFRFVWHALTDFEDGFVGLGNIIGNDCPNKEDSEVCGFENDCSMWQCLSPSPWKVTKAFEQSAVLYDQSLHSEEGSYLSGTLHWQTGCNSFLLQGASIGDLNSAAACFNFYGGTFTLSGNSTAQFFAHVQDPETAKFVDTVWNSGLLYSRSELSWSAFYTYLDLSDAFGTYTDEIKRFKIVLEARLCSETGSGTIVIDSLSKISTEKCKIPGDEDFETPYSIWQPMKLGDPYLNWIIAESNDGLSLVSPLDKNYLARFQSGTIFPPTKSRCVSFWFNVSTGASLGALIRDEQTASDNFLWTVQGNDEIANNWKHGTFSYYTHWHHRISFESVNGQVVIDDIALVDGLCGCKPESSICIVPYAEYNPLAAGDKDEFYPMIGSCSAADLEVFVPSDISLKECRRECQNYPENGCSAFVYSFNDAKCQLKSSHCSGHLIEQPNGGRVETWQRKQLDDFYDSPGQCLNSIPLQEVTSADLRDCADQCIANSECALFVFDSAQNICWLHEQCPIIVLVADRTIYEMIGKSRFHFGTIILF